MEKGYPMLSNHNGELDQQNTIVEVPLCIRWGALTPTQRSSIRELSGELLQYGVKSDEQFNRLFWLLDYAYKLGLLDKDEHRKAFDLASEWVLFPESRWRVEYELLESVPWKLACDEGKYPPSPYHCLDVEYRDCRDTMNAKLIGK